MKVDEFLDELSEMIEDSKEMPMFGKIMVDKKRVSDIIDEIKANLPPETRQAKRIVAERNKIIEEARRQAQAIVNGANQQRSAMLSQSEVVVEARQEADRILKQAEANAAEKKTTMHNYIDRILSDTERILIENQKELDENFKKFHAQRVRLAEANNNARNQRPMMPKTVPPVQQDSEQPQPETQEPDSSNETYEDE